MKRASFFGKKNLVLGLWLVIQSASAADLSLEILVNKKEANLGDTVSAILTLNKNGRGPASGISVGIVLSEGLTLIFPSPEMGSFDARSKHWKIAQFPDNQSNTKLSFRILVNGEGPLGIQTEVLKANEPDPDSSPGNAKMGEDDLAFGYVSVPIVFCGNAEIKLAAEAFPGFTGYQWLLDGIEIPEGKSRRLEISKTGRYTCQVNETNNSDAASFPVIVRRAPELVAQIGERFEVCAGETLKLRVEPKGGTRPFRYDWSNDLGLDLEKPLKANADLEIKVKIMDAVGCSIGLKTHVRVLDCGTKG